MQYFLALDAGGTKTIGAIGDGERELARASAGAIKVLRTDPEIARENLRLLLAQLSAKSAVDLRSLRRICVGIAGIRTPRVAGWVRSTLPQFARGELLLCGDEEIALDAAFEGGPGVLVVSGTGSNAIGRGLNGQMASAGGWGPHLGDEGSGHWIGQEAVRKALRARDEGHPSRLLEAAAECWGLHGADQLEQLVERANAASPPSFSELAPVVAACAQAGDAVAIETASRAGKELARLAHLVTRQLRAGGEESAFRVAFAGSVLTSDGPFREATIKALQQPDHKLEIVSAPVDPVAGALWRARHGIPQPYNGDRRDAG